MSHVEFVRSYGSEGTYRDSDEERSPSEAEITTGPGQKVSPGAHPNLPLFNESAPPRDSAVAGSYPSYHGKANTRLILKVSGVANFGLPQNEEALLLGETSGARGVGAFAEHHILRRNESLVEVPILSFPLCGIVRRRGKIKGRDISNVWEVVSNER